MLDDQKTTDHDGNTDSSAGGTRSSRNNGSYQESDGIVSDFHAEKLDTRRFEWQVDWKLLAYTAVALVAVCVLVGGSYAYHSSSAAGTFMSRADMAAEQGDHADEVRWLANYLLLEPEDEDAIVRIAIAADEAVDQAGAAQRIDSVETARKRLGLALAAVGDPEGMSDPKAELRLDLRKRLIKRLLMTYVGFARDIEKQVIELGADKDDPDAHRWMALAIVRQIAGGIYQSRDALAADRHDRYYAWLSNQSPGLVVTEAIERNPDDLELVEAFFGLLATDPGSFGLTVSNPGETGTFKRAVEVLRRQGGSPIGDTLDSVVVGLSSRSDARGVLLLHQYYSQMEKTDEAYALIIDAAANASRRLGEADLTPKSSGQEVAEDSEDEAEFSEDEKSELRWEYQCVFVGASSVASKAMMRQATEQEVELAKDWLAQLRAVDAKKLAFRNEVVVRTYLFSGLLAAILDERGQAVALWREGLKVTEGEDLGLIANVAWALSVDLDDDASVREAEQAIERLQAAIKEYRDELLLLTGEGATAEERETRTKIVTGAEWKGKVAKALVLSRGDSSSEKYRATIELLDGVTDQSVGIEPVIRRAGVTLLSDAYQRLGMWDLSAQTLTKAVELFPGDLSLIQASAQAWERTGNRGLAQKQWSRLESSGGPDARLIQLQSEFLRQTRLLPERRNLDQLSSQLDEIESEFRKSDLVDEARMIDLNLLRLMFPPAGTDLNSHLASAELAEQVTALARENPDLVRLQIYAANRLASVDRYDEAMELLAPLMNGDLLSDSDKRRTEAGVMASAEKYAEAAELLVGFVSENPDSAQSLAPVAAEYAARVGESELAEKALLQIPDERLSAGNVHSLYRLAEARDDEDALKRYLEKLHAIENYDDVNPERQDGVYSLYVQARSLADKLLKKPIVSRDEPDYVQARKIVDRLQTLRPNWGPGIALRGWLSFARGEFVAAEEQLRQGIDAGDTTATTVQLHFQSLVRLGRDREIDEAIRIANMSGGANLNSLGQVEIGKSIRDRDFSKALESSRELAEQKPDDPYSQLVYARVAMEVRKQILAGTAVDETNDPKKLLSEAVAAVDRAEQAASSASERLSVLSMRMSLAVGTQDRQAIEKVLDALESGDYPKAGQLGLMVEALIALNRNEEAIGVLEQLNRLAPNMRSLMTLVRLLRAENRNEEALTVLRRAHQADPNDSLLRAELAEQIVNTENEFDWDAVANLLTDEATVTSRNQLVYAILLAAKGDFFKRLEAVSLLRNLASSSPDVRVLATRFQAALMYEMARDADQLEKEERDQLDISQYFTDARRLFKELAESNDPAIVDLARYCAFLINMDEQGDRIELQKMIERLDEVPRAAVQVLNVEMLRAQETGKTSDLPEIVAQWVQDHSAEDLPPGIKRIELVAGEALLRQDFVDEALDWFSKAYEADRSTFREYAVALATAKRYEESAKLAADHYDEEPLAGTAVLVCEVCIGMGANFVPKRYSELLADAMRKFPGDPALNEGFATLAMQSGENQKAIGYYLRVLRADKRRVRTLNNLAMLYAETPNKEILGLQHIDSAIEIRGEVPELLDTKGTVLLRAGRFSDAAEVFARAIELSEEPRYKFHMVQTLVELGDAEKAKSVWSQIDFDKLDLRGLTPSERGSVGELHQRFGTESKKSKEAA